MATVSELIDQNNRPLISPELQSIIDKVSGMVSTPVGGARGITASQRSLGGKLVDTVGGLQEKTMQDTAVLERTKLGEVGATERAKIGIMPGMAENQRKSQMFNFPGIGATPAQPATGNWWENWK